jgi:hypothetical protein
MTGESLDERRAKVEASLEQTARDVRAAAALGPLIEAAAATHPDATTIRIEGPDYRADLYPKGLEPKDEITEE